MCLSCMSIKFAAGSRLFYNFGAAMENSLPYAGVYRYVVAEYLGRIPAT